jgi:hypothetical protein
MASGKIVNEQEVVRWFEEGRTYQWMVEEYKRKYNIETVPSLWGNFRRRRGLPRRITRDDELIPWFVDERHRWAYPLAMLRVEGRRRAGRPLRAADQRRLDSWLQYLHDENVVVHYDPQTRDGFFYVPRESGDDDIIRRPARTTTLRRAAD